jgi:hypothetical protein
MMGLTGRVCLRSRRRKTTSRRDEDEDEDEDGGDEGSTKSGQA